MTRRGSVLGGRARFGVSMAVVSGAAVLAPVSLGAQETIPAPAELGERSKVVTTPKPARPKTPPKPKPYPLLRLEPSRAPVGAVVEIVAATGVDLESIAEYEGAFVSCGSERVELLYPQDNRAAFKVPAFDATKERFVPVRIATSDNESTEVRLELIPAEQTVIPAAEKWAVLDVSKGTLVENQVVRVRLNRELPVQYSGQVRLLVSGVDARIVRMHSAAFDIQVPRGVPPQPQFELFVGSSMGQFSLAQPPPPTETPTAPPVPSATGPAPEAVPTEALPLDDFSLWQVVLAGLALAGGGLGLGWGWSRGRRRLEKERRLALDAMKAELQATLEREAALREALLSSKDLAEEPRGGQSPARIALPSPSVSLVPEVPDELVATCAAGNCVLYVGGRLRATQGLPTWSELLTKLVSREEVRKEIGPSALVAAQSGDQKAAQLVRILLPAATLHSALVAEFARGSGVLPEVYVKLASLPFVGAMTTSWDTLLDQALAARSPKIVSPRDGERVAEAVRGPQSFLIKLLGSLEREDSFDFTNGERERTLYENESARKALTSLLLSKSFVFVGTSVSGIEMFLSLLGLRSKSTLVHYALVPHDADTELDQSRLLELYGVKLIPYGATEGHPEVERFVTNLSERVAAFGGVRSNESRSLDRVRLENIGPFEKAELVLGKQWNVLLGNNGCGKSTFLRAIAVGLCGADANGWKGAGELLRTGQKSGSIELTVGTVTYRTELVRDGDGVSVKSATVTPLQAKQWVAVGFPPLRGSAFRESTGPRLAGSRQPQVEDLKPLVTGGVDSRMDDLKQWVVNLSVAAESTDLEEASAAKALRDKVFELLGALTPGVECRFSRLDQRKWQVWVQTQDAEVPFSLVSQGTHSVFGWVGALLMRLHETRPDSAARSEEAPALVLIDEIDAHMHPEWQQRLIPTLRKLVPNLQVVATTHSPLIVSSTQPGEVVRFLRDEQGHLAITTLDDKILYYRADQVLTSDAFSLATTRGEKTEELIARYTRLLGKADPSQADLDAIEELRDRLRDVLSLGETARERAQQRAKEDEIAAAAEAERTFEKPALDPKDEAELKRQLNKLLGTEGVE